MQLRYVLALLALVAVVAVAGRRPFRRGRHSQGFVLRRPNRGTIQQSATLGGGTINQIIDHFGTNNGTWKQRYFYNTQYGTSNVNILYIEGEGAADISSIEGSTNPFVIYAKKLNASLYSLEHRFYGLSHPFNDISVASLKYLSSRQALADLAAFAQQMNVQLGGQQKWIAVGGSYSGNLALWLRQKYPDVFIGSVGSSGPVLAQVDFYGYLEVVENDVFKYDAKQTGDHLLCADQISKAFDSVQGLMQSKEGRDTLDSKFYTDPKLNSYATLTKNSIDYFYQGLVGPFMSAAQYGGLFTYATVDTLCDKMTVKNKDPVDLLAGIVYDGYGVDTDYQGDVTYVGGTNWGDQERTDERAWIWQTCTEFGYFQSTDRGSNIFRATFPVNTYMELCLDVFGIQLNTLKASIDATNAYYGERNYYTGTNVVISLGTADPWHYLTKQTSEHESVIVTVIERGMHCSDFYDPCEFNFGCLDGVKTAQTLTLNAMLDWINPISSVPNSISISDSMGTRPSIYKPFHSAPLPVTANAPGDAPVSQKKTHAVKQLASAGSSKPPVSGPLRTINVFTGRHRDGLRQPPKDEGKAWPASMTQGTVTQPFDHFDNSNPNTFQERFWMNNKFGSSSGPNFLMIGGEGEESSSWLTNENLAWVTYASKTGANLYLLEHRYYGDSKLGTNDLEYLTSAQMLYDVANFIKIAKRERGVTGPWITFGGSYSGALSAWAREWFPELIAGAVGSSGPVEAKTDFWEYLKVVEKTIVETSPACVLKIQAGFARIFQMTLTGAGRKQLSDKFKLQPAWTADQTVSAQDIQEVIAGIYVYFQTVAQYSDDNNSAGSRTVTAVCNIMTDAQYTDPTDAVLAVLTWYYGGFFPGVGSSYQADVGYYKELLSYVDGHDASVSNGDLSSLLWTWQTCNEFGYYQSTDGGLGIFTDAVPVNYYVALCEDVFGVKMHHIEAAVSRTVYQYGGRKHYKGTNVVLPNGSHDPWHALGLLDATGLDPTVVPIMINGTAHCADMYAERANDPQQLKDARKTILNNIVHWVVNGKKRN